ncbi:DUF1943 domain-containing protein, partial [Salmonella enterica subsp. enterica serovar Typhimurium]|nr:DUF1943 domain-containing protein [Salmonella enterica subsp. enterica serovar Typhimurium]
MVNSFDDLLNNIKALFKNYTEQGWTRELMKDNMMKFVEGNLQFKSLGAQRFWPFELANVKNIPEVIRQFARDHRTPRSFNYTKFFTDSTVIYGFPTVMGFPGVYTLHSPALWKVNGSLFFKSVPDLATDPHYLPGIVDITLKLRSVYSSKLQSKLSIMTPFNDVRYTAGISRSVHLHLPVQMNIHGEFDGMKYLRQQITPLDSRDHRLLQWTSVPFTTIHNIRNFRPDSE